MKTLMIAAVAALLATSAQATVWPSPEAEADARAAAKAGASSESIALGLVKNHNVTSVQTAMDLANEVTQNQQQGQHQGQEQTATADNGGNSQVVEGTEIPSVTAGFHFQAPNLAGRAPIVAPGAPEVALNRGISTLLGAVQWDKLETTHSGVIAWLTEFFPRNAVRAYLCNEVDGIADAVRAAGVACPGDTIGDLQ
jgi:hypothetical protein